MKRAEICIDARMATCSGIGTYIRSLLPRLANPSYHWKMIIDRCSFKQCPELASFETIFTSAPIYSAQEQITVPFSVPKCDLFWTPHFNIPLFPIRAQKRLVTLHDVYFLAHLHEFPFHKRFYSKLLHSAAIRKSDHIITVSQFSRQEILDYTRATSDQITVIPLGVNPYPSNELVHCIPLSLPAKYALFVGLLTPRKNICRLLQALDFLPSDVHLVIAGKETEWDAWKLEVKKRQSQVTVLGQVPHDTLAYLYHHATLLIHPSLYEGFGLTPLEAMSAGCPVVISQTTSLPEVCQDAAFYIDPLYPKSIAQGILAVWSNPELQEHMRASGKQYIQYWNWDTSAQKHLELIASLLLP